MAKANTSLNLGRFIKEIFAKEKWREKAHFICRMDEWSEEIGKMVNLMVMVKFYFQITEKWVESSKMVSLSDLQTSSLLNSKLKGNFQLNQRPNSRKLQKVITSKVNLEMDFLMEMDHTKLLKVIYSKEIS